MTISEGPARFYLGFLPRTLRVPTWVTNPDECYVTLAAENPWPYASLSIIEKP